VLGQLQHLLEIVDITLVVVAVEAGLVLEETVAQAVEVMAVMLQKLTHQAVLLILAEEVVDQTLRVQQEEVAQVVVV
jgi:hypothetical protein